MKLQVVSIYSLITLMNFTHLLVSPLTHLPLDKMTAILQMIFLDAYSWMKKNVFWLKFHWSLFLKTQLTKTQHWHRQWLGAEKATSHNLNKCSPDSRTHILGREIVPSGVLSWPTLSVKTCLLATKTCSTYAFVTQQPFCAPSRNLGTCIFVSSSIVVLAVPPQYDAVVHATGLVATACIRTASTKNLIHRG